MTPTDDHISVMRRIREETVFVPSDRERQCREELIAAKLIWYQPYVGWHLTDAGEALYQMNLRLKEKCAECAISREEALLLPKRLADRLYAWVTWASKYVERPLVPSSATRDETQRALLDAVIYRPKGTAPLEGYLDDIEEDDALDPPCVSDRDVRCEVCRAVGQRSGFAVAPQNWLFLEAQDEHTGMITVVYACSDSCAVSLWRRGPGKLASVDQKDTEAPRAFNAPPAKWSEADCNYMRSAADVVESSSYYYKAGLAAEIRSIMQRMMAEKG